MSRMSFVYKGAACALAVHALSMAPMVASANYETNRSGSFGGLELNWNNRFAAGVAIRTQDQKSELIDKQNHPDNQRIYVETTVGLLNTPVSGFFLPCELPLGSFSQYYIDNGITAVNISSLGDCMSQTGNPLPSQWLLSRPGGYMINNDDGNLNYDKGDITYANLRLRSELSGTWRNFSFKVGGIAFHDPVNNPHGFNHPQRRNAFRTHLADNPVLDYAGRNLPIQMPLPPGVSPPPGTSPTAPTNLFNSNAYTSNIDRSSRAHRPDHVGDLFTDIRVLEAYVSGMFDIAGRDVQVTVGNQYLRWGESTFTIFNTLNQVNPLSAILYRQPGSEVRDGFLPVGMITLNAPLTERSGIEFFYQYDWKPAEPDICGSFLSTSDVAGCGSGPTPIYAGLGNAPEAPEGGWIPGGVAGTQTLASRTLYLMDEKYGYAQNGKQFGLRFDHYSDFLGGTELSLYAMNIHSRLPYYSVYAANDQCEGRYEDSAFPHCIAIQRRFLDATDLEVPTVGARKALSAYRVDSMRPFLEYPEDIRIFGLSGTTTLGDWSFAGEVSYSPNQPAQVSVVDVTYAGVQPSFPHSSNQAAALAAAGGDWHDISLPGLGGSNVTLEPTGRSAVPDFLMSRYRSGCGARDPVCEMEAAAAIRGGDYIQGFERLKVGQAALTGIRIFSGSNPLRADQIQLVTEVAAIRVFDMPRLDDLQFQGSGAFQTHYSSGHADYDPELHGPSGPATNSPRLVGPTDRFNPMKADPKTFAEDFAWGYRIRIEATYNDLIWGTGFRPRVQLYHDVRGTSISPGQDFVHGRKEWTLQNEFLFTNNFSALARYVIFHGAGDRNLRIDRNYAEVSFTYAF